MLDSVGGARANFSVTDWENDAGVQDAAHGAAAQEAEVQGDTTVVNTSAGDTAAAKTLEQDSLLLRRAVEEKLNASGAEAQPSASTEEGTTQLSEFDAQVQGDIQRAIETNGTDPIIDSVTDMMPGFTAEQADEALTWKLSNGQENYTLQIRDGLLKLSTDDGKSVSSRMPARLDRGSGPTTNFGMVRAKLRNLHVRLRAM